MANEEQGVELFQELPHSIELHRDAKGVYRWDIKLRSLDGEELEMVSDLSKIDAELRNRFIPKDDDTLLKQLEASIERVNETKSTRRPTAPAGSAQAVSERLGKAIETAQRAQENYPA